VEVDPENDVPADWIPWMLDESSTESQLARRDGRVCGARLVEKTMAGRPFVARAEGAYLVTGGAGALGLAVAEWLVTRGAGEIVLAGRRPATPELKATIAAWALRGARVAYAMADVGDAASVRRLVTEAEAHWPLRGVFHAAGALRDGLLRQAEAETFTSILGPKIDGAWELHQATKGKPLDCFVLFSSIASLLGSPAQANYAAGNAFLDGLARYREAAGLPALSVQWGPWDEIGMTARLAERDRQRLAERGLLPMTPARAIETMERLLGGASGCVGVWAWDRAKYRVTLPEGVPAFYRRVFSDAPPAVVEARADGEAKANLAALPPTQRTEAIEQLISKSVASILGLASPLDVDRAKGLFDIGIDSLTAIDLKLRLEKALGQPLRTTIAFDYPTAAAMAAHLAVALFPAAVEPVLAATPRASEPAALPDDFNHLTTSDLEALLEKELKD
jgi:NAD(P)-dependent dehydrogenase (short-subunit alcohol dehydrogenase family)/acyl carrier protein